jgi:putative transposase
MFAGEIRRRRVRHMRQFTHWRWRLDEMYVRINGEMRYLWRAVDNEGEVLESFVTKERDKAEALKFIKKAMKRHGRPKAIVTDGLRSYGAALTELGIADRQATGRWLNNRIEGSHVPIRRRERAMARFRRMKTLQKLTSVHASSTTTFPGAPSRRPPDLQAETLRRAGGVAVSPGLKSGPLWAKCARPETSCRWTDST